MSLVQALTATALSPSPVTILGAHKALSAYIRTGYGVRPLALAIHVDTDTRRKMRALLDRAALSDSTVRIGFLKACGEMRYMVARPCHAVDGTCRYYTVEDLELSEARGSTVYRRVNLDTVVAVDVQFRAS